MKLRNLFFGLMMFALMLISFDVGTFAKDNDCSGQKQSFTKSLGLSLQKPNKNIISNKYFIHFC